MEDNVGVPVILSQKAQFSYNYRQNTVYLWESAASFYWQVLPKCWCK